jgi:hypothetical protein
MPKIADQLERLNTNIEALVVELRSVGPPHEAKTSEPDPQDHGETRGR